MTAPPRSSGATSRFLARLRPQREKLPRDIKVMLAAAFLIALGFGLVAPVLPQFATTFGVGNTEAAVIVAIFAFMRLAFAPAGGALIGRRGERPIYVAGLLIVALSTAACAFAQDYWQLLLFRGLGGAGSVMFTVASMALVVRLAPPQSRGRVSGAYASAFLIGNVWADRGRPAGGTGPAGPIPCLRRRTACGRVRCPDPAEPPAPGRRRGTGPRPGHALWRSAGCRNLQVRPGLQLCQWVGDLWCPDGNGAAVRRGRLRGRSSGRWPGTGSICCRQRRCPDLLGTAGGLRGAQAHDDLRPVGGGPVHCSHRHHLRPALVPGGVDARRRRVRSLRSRPAGRRRRCHWQRAVRGQGAGGVPDDVRRRSDRWAARGGDAGRQAGVRLGFRRDRRGHAPCSRRLAAHPRDTARGRLLSAPVSSAGRQQSLRCQRGQGRRRLRPAR
ncbi:membrane hypothetical protein [Arthrobacter sp. 8AJ]|nr:membrane hypothetical protein [Arthrobacter sp. 8AJ]